MITTQDLQEAIAECKGERNPNANTCVKLAAYYTIMDHMGEGIDKRDEYAGYSYAIAPIPTVSYNSNTEFAGVIKDMNVNDIVAVMDELMSTLSIVNPSLYAGVIRKLGEV